MELKIVNHFDTDDIKFSNDVLCIDLLVNDNIVLSGDHYHHKINDQIYGFIEALKYLDIQFTKEIINIADGEY